MLLLSGRKQFSIIVFCHQEMELKVGCFYVVKLNTKKAPVFYVGKMIGEDEISEDILMEFYRRGQDNRFRLPERPDQNYVSKDDIHVKLPEPTRLSGSRSRNESGLRFEIELGMDVK